MTRPDEGLVPTEVPGPTEARGRVIDRVPGIPGARAVVGGLLVAAAGVGTFVSWQQASGSPDRSYAVAARDLAPGQRITGESIRFVAVDLPESVASAAFESPAELEGRVLVAPVGDGELLQLGAVSDQVGGEPAAEVSITLARDLAVDGRIAAGDTVDVYATEDETTVAARGVRVVAVTEAGGSFGDGSELTVTLALTRADDGVPIVQAAREGQVTLVRTTHASPRASSSGNAGAESEADEGDAADGSSGTSSSGGASGTGAAPGAGATDTTATDPAANDTTATDPAATDPAATEGAG